MQSRITEYLVAKPQRPSNRGDTSTAIGTGSSAGRPAFGDSGGPRREEAQMETPPSQGFEDGAETVSAG
jgi:hypothetical protein